MSAARIDDQIADIGKVGTLIGTVANQHVDLAVMQGIAGGNVAAYFCNHNIGDVAGGQPELRGACRIDMYLNFRLASLHRIFYVRQIRRTGKALRNPVADCLQCMEVVTDDLDFKRR